MNSFMPRNKGCNSCVHAYKVENIEIDRVPHTGALCAKHGLAGSEEYLTIQRNICFEF